VTSLIETATHEVPHYFIAAAQRVPVRVLSIERDTDSVGRVELDVTLDRDERPAPAPTPEALVWVAAFALAGGIGEQVLNGTETPRGCDDDQRVAWNAILALGDITGCPAWACRRAIHEATENYLRANVEKLRLLVTALLHERAISGARAKEIVGDLPPLDFEPVRFALAYFSARERQWEQRKARARAARAAQ